MDKLNSMRVFAEVARLGSYTAAAEELGISRAMASRHVNQLEDSLNVRLFNRTTRHISLTEVGRSYHERVKLILGELEDTERAITELHSEPRGTLKIMAPPSFGSFHLARAISAYKELYPDVIIEMILTDRTPDLVEEGIDLAIVLGELDDSSLIARHIATSRRVVCGAQEYLNKSGIPQTPEELEQHNCLTLTHRSPLSDWRFIIDGREIKFYPDGNFKSNTADPLRIAAINGCGLVQLPSYMVGLDIQSTRLQPLLEQFEPEELPISAVYVHRRHLSTKIRTFVDFICDRFLPTPYWDNWIPES
ncbi:MAG TPA: LysR family transcriptional regulator [Gammaproteobacteria bacterium]|nr:LysR family transcriptional regulator [Gammaproteobacteria bacterium]